MMITNHQH
jgi:1-acyl-sn-glycerol-3-phosphate acyltransferase